jgi:acyl-[acyl-carrier-protein] desaturase
MQVVPRYDAERTGRDLFGDFASCAESTGTYTAYDYSEIMAHLIKRWKIADLDGLSGEAAEAQEYLMVGRRGLYKLNSQLQSRRLEAPGFNP